MPGMALRKGGKKFMWDGGIYATEAEAKEKMADRLLEETPPSIGGENISDILSIDGVKYILADDSWLLIRPSGTEPVLRVYAEGRSPEMVEALMAFGEQIAENST